MPGTQHDISVEELQRKLNALQLLDDFLDSTEQSEEETVRNLQEQQEIENIRNSLL